MTPFLSARLPGRSAAAFLTACLVVASAASLALAAQSDTADAASAAAQLEWARDALARNQALEVVSTDPANRTITVRVKVTGQVRKVRADQVVAMVPTDTSARRSQDFVALEPTSAAPVDGRVIASGPGYSITAVSPAAGAGAPQTTAQIESATGAGAARNLPVEYRHEPFICQGSQLVRIDNRNLVFDGDAVTVEKGCQLLITNSAITAHGIGITARGASVHVDNSIIEGSGEAIDVSDGAQVYARFSVFKGLIRRNDTSDFHDLGGNVGN